MRLFLECVHSCNALYTFHLFDIVDMFGLIFPRVMFATPGIGSVSMVRRAGFLLCISCIRFLGVVVLFGFAG